MECFWQGMIIIVFYVKRTEKLFILV